MPSIVDENENENENNNNNNNNNNENENGPSCSSCDSAALFQLPSQSRYGDAFLTRCLDLDEQKSWGYWNTHTFEDGEHIACWMKTPVPAKMRCTRCGMLEEDHSQWQSCRQNIQEHGVLEPAYQVAPGNIEQWAKHLYNRVGEVTVEAATYSDLWEMFDNLAESSMWVTPNLEPSLPRNAAPTLLQIQVFDSSDYDEARVKCYTSKRVWGWDPGGFLPDPMLRIPDILNTQIESAIMQMENKPSQHGGTKSDVWSMSCPSSLVSSVRERLDDFAAWTNDRPIPRYQMIIDPNQFVRNGKWVPCEFDISHDGQQVHLVGQDRAHWLDTSFIRTVSEPVLQASLPLLAKLRRPCLLLEGQRLQVVVKAQRIIVPPRAKRQEDGEGDYVGLWHVDGEKENVVAVVLFYYNVSTDLQGGKMEFLDRSVMDVLLAEGGENHEGYGQVLRQRLRGSESGEDHHINCSVPIEEGTMLVFSNFQMAHRVLRMRNTSTESDASRDFVALFIVDPAGKPLVPSRCHLAEKYLYQRTLSSLVLKAGDQGSQSQPKFLRDEPLRHVLEYLGLRVSMRERLRTRNEMLRSQLKPRGVIGGPEGQVYSTGNGCFTMIGWLDKFLEARTVDNCTYNSGHDGEYHTSEHFPRQALRAEALNVPPAQLGRGLSETLSIESDELENLIDFEAFRYKGT